MDIKVSNNHLENAPTDKLPQKEDGSLDYENMTIAQQFAYTCKTESLKVALKDLNADIKLLEKNIAKIKKEAASLYGSDRAKLRDSVRNEEQKLREMYELHNIYASSNNKILRYAFVLFGIIIVILIFIYTNYNNNSDEKNIVNEQPQTEENIFSKNSNETIFEDDLSKLYYALIEYDYPLHNIENEELFYEKMCNKNNQKKLYDYIKSKNEIKIGDFEEYKDRITVATSRRWLYKKLSNNYNLGDYKNFWKRMNDKTIRRTIFENAIAEGLNVGSWEEFNQIVNYNTPKSDFEQPTDIQPRKYPKTQSTTSSLQVPASTEATWEETLFDTGDIPYLSHYGKGKYDYKSLSELKIINYSERDAVVLLENEAGNVVRNNYVDTGEIFHVKHIPAGNYIIKVMYGNSWNADKNNGAGYPKGGFMKNESFSSTQWNDSFNFYPEKTDEGTTYPTYSVTLHKVQNGNLETKAINKADFFN